MKKLLQVLAITLLAVTSISLKAQTIQLANGWKLNPAGTSFALGDLPLNIEVSNTGKYMAVTNNGQGYQSIELIDTKSEKIIDSVSIAKSWYGLKFSADEKYLYVGAGHDNRINKYAIQNNKLIFVDSLLLGNKWPEKIGPAGIEINESTQQLFVVTREDKQLYIFDLNTKKIIGKYGLAAEAFTCKLSPNKSILYISCWGADQVLVFDLKTKTWAPPITVGDNPNEMLITNTHLFVCNANDNSVSIIDIAKNKIVEILDAALYPNAPSGSTTNSLAIDKKNNRLFIANADNNCLAVFDIAKIGSSKSVGFIPTGWYPTSVRFLNNKIWVANGKGFTPKANPFGPSPIRKKGEVIHHMGVTKTASSEQYIGALFTGTMSIITNPTALELTKYTKTVYKNTPYTAAKLTQADSIEAGNPIPSKVGQPSPIKYVFYIIKENRTYDQVLADMPGGNGDTSLLLFGKNITPNQHAIASNFVLLDNFYVDSEVSADGHNWSMGAYATDYLEKTWPTSYSGRGGTYGGEGEREIANNKNGFIWNNCYRAGISYRSYGEFVTGGKATVPVLNDHFCKDFPSYGLNITDTLRFKRWQKDFDSLLAKGQVPKFNTVRFGNDHTEGTRIGRPTPYAHVADNDLAVGLFLEHLAKSSIWNESAVFVLEDDAQNGADHVDAHRSPAYVFGGFVKRNFIDHTPYSTSGMLRTMELILGLPPMSQYDAGATPLWRCFANTPTPFNYKAIIPSYNLLEKNTAYNEWQKRSEKLNFVKEDTNNDLEFSKILWHAIKGNDIPFPAPRRAAFIIPSSEKDDD